MSTIATTVSVSLPPWFSIISEHNIALLLHFVCESVGRADGSSRIPPLELADFPGLVLVRPREFLLCGRWEGDQAPQKAMFTEQPRNVGQFLLMRCILYGFECTRNQTTNTPAVSGFHYLALLPVR
jgi:hypothetical protein